MFKRLKKSSIWKPFVFFTGIIAGFLIFNQYEVHKMISKDINRDTNIGIFEEIDFMLRTNKKLKEEINELDKNIKEYSNRALSRDAIEADIKKYKMILGRINIKGKGVLLSVSAPLSAAFMVDLINEFLNAGAEAVSINGIRIGEGSKGFISTGKKILFGSILLSPPYIFEAIGDSVHLEKALKQSGGILIRIRQAFPDAEISIEKKDEITMKKLEDSENGAD